jgi:hypothetical protein
VESRAGRIEINSDGWPVVRVDYVGDVQLDVLRDAAQRYAELAERARARGELLCWLVDLDRFEPRLIDALRRRVAGEILAQYTPRIATGTLAEARICRSSLTRGVMTAVAWMVRQPWPTQIFATRQEAESWLREQAKRIPSHGT